MEKTVLHLALIIISTYIVPGTEGSGRSSACGDDSWIAYKDRKCFKLFTTFATRNHAEDVCNQQSGTVSVPTLAIIRSADEQKFLVKYIFNASDSNVWIGAERRLGSSNKFDWNDGTPVERYTNWEVGHPTEDVRRTCVQMRRVDMQWSDIACTAGNWFVCQKMQSWSMKYIHQALVAIRRDLIDVKNQLHALQVNQSELQENQTALVYNFTRQMTDVNSQLKELRDSDLRKNQVELADTFTNQMTDMINQLGELRNSQKVVTDNFTSQLAQTRNQLRLLEDNPVPIDFIYVQLHTQPNPRTLWPRVLWQDITGEYAGLFFRAQGTNSSAFGVIQEQSSAALRIQTVQTELWNGSFWINPNNAFSNGVVTGQRDSTPANWGMQFALTSAEVRPRNAAVRIWKRIG